jgi:hypothetical protein
MVQRLAETEEARLKTLSARREAAQGINELLQNFELPAAIGEFLKGPWYDSAQLVLVKYGAASREWQDMLRATRHLMESVQPQDNADEVERDRRAQMLRHLPGELRRWLVSLEHDSEETDSAIGLVEYAHLRIQHGQLLQLAPVSPLAVEQADAGSGEEEEEPLTCGDWYRFSDEDGELRAQLVLQLEGGQHLLFTNFVGLKALDLSHRAFRQRVHDGFARALPNRATFSLSLAAAAGIDSDEALRALTDPQHAGPAAAAPATPVGQDAGDQSYGDGTAPPAGEAAPGSGDSADDAAGWERAATPQASGSEPWHHDAPAPASAQQPAAEGQPAPAWETAAAPSPARESWEEAAPAQPEAREEPGAAPAQDEQPAQQPAPEQGWQAPAAEPTWQTASPQESPSDLSSPAEDAARSAPTGVEDSQRPPDTGGIPTAASAAPGTPQPSPQQPSPGPDSPGWAQAPQPAPAAAPAPDAPWQNQPPQSPPPVAPPADPAPAQPPGWQQPQAAPPPQQPPPPQAPEWQPQQAAPTPQEPAPPPHWQPPPSPPPQPPPGWQPPPPEPPPPQAPAPPPHAGVNRSPVERQIEVPMGAWIGFHDGETPIMAKLAVYDPRRDNYIFVNRKGIALRELSRSELVTLMDQGLVDILETRSYFRDEVQRARGEQP